MASKLVPGRSTSTIRALLHHLLPTARSTPNPTRNATHSGVQGQQSASDACKGGCADRLGCLKRCVARHGVLARKCGEACWPCGRALSGAQLANQHLHNDPVPPQRTQIILPRLVQLHTHAAAFFRLPVLWQRGHLTSNFSMGVGCDELAISWCCDGAGCGTGAG